MTPVPTACWLPEPAPLLVAIGSTPKINASEVIRIGRRRMRDASSVADIRSCPLWFSSLANSTIRMAFFADSPMMVNRPTWK